MARTLRVEYAGACYHVINRGNYRRGLFAESGAAEAFERTLAQTAVKFGWRVHAYVVMRNHFHLAVQINEPNLSLGMKWLQGTWVQRFNRYRKLVGRPFQGRYKAILVEPGHSLAQVCHYIHLNPLRAGIVNLETVGSFSPCSLMRFKSRARPVWLDSSTVLTALGNLPDEAKSWEAYLSFLEVLSTDPTARRELTSAKISRGWCHGSTEFKRSVRAELARAGMTFEASRFAGLEPEVVQQEREAAWRERLEALARAAGLSLEPLSKKKSDPDKLLLAAAIKRSTSASNKWLSAQLNLGCPRAISISISRWLSCSGNQHRLTDLLHVAT